MPKKTNPSKKQDQSIIKETTQDTKKKEAKKPGNVYDDILRENAPKFFKPLLEKVLGFPILSFSYVPDKETQTLMREMDFFYTIETTEEMGGKMILHIEFQTQKDKDMIYRIAEYHGMALRRHQLPIKHVVIYLGTNKVSMVSKLKPSEVFTSFELINLRALNLEEYLSAQVPEVIILAVLTNYPKEQLEPVLRSIVKRLQEVVKNDRKLREYLTQLGLIARLRDKTNLTNKILQEMPIYYDVENDLLYRQGYDKATKIFEEKMELERKKKEAERKAEKEAERKRVEAEKEIEKVAALLSLGSSFEEAQIATAAQITIERLREIRKDLGI